MEAVGLPRGCVVVQEGGFWILRWSEQSTGMREAEQTGSSKTARIGIATGSDALSENDARLLARKYLLSQLAPEAQARRALMTLADFVEMRFLPEFVAEKNLGGRAHYRSILKQVLSPDVWGRIFGNTYATAPMPSADRPGWPYLDSLRLRDTRPRHVQQLLAAASADGYSPQTVRHIRSVVSAIFAFAKQELVFAGANPARLAKAPDVVRKSAPLLTLAQTEQIIRAMRYPEKEMMLFALLTDMNVSEICGLQWKYVNLTGAPLRAHDEYIPPLTIAVHKRWYRGELADAKEARRRLIHIPESLLPVLLLLKGSTRFGEPEDFVLTSRSGAAINATNITTRRLGVIGEKLHISELTWQALRRAQAAMKVTYGAQFPFYIASTGVLDAGQEITPARSISRSS